MVFNIALIEVGARGLFLLAGVLLEIPGAEVCNGCAFAPGLPHGPPDPRRRNCPEDLRLFAGRIGRPRGAVFTD